MATAKPSIPPIKNEGTDAQNNGLSSIKAEPDSRETSFNTQLDDDIYEDAGDLDFSQSSQALFLTRLPKYLWKAWSQLDDDADIEVGQIRIEGGMENPKRLSLLLNSKLPVNHPVPKEYNLQITNTESSNIFVFTEKDLPGYNNRLKISANKSQDTASLPFSQATPRGLPDRNKVAPGKVEKNKKSKGPYFRRAIPKKTAISGRVKTETNCLPVENEDYHRVMAERAKLDMKPKRETQLLSTEGTPYGSATLRTGMYTPQGKVPDAFVKPVTSQRAKGGDNRTARIPQNVLLDRIMACFKQYKYWPLKSLKAKLQQPEAYLRQNLELVAHLVRQGPFAMNWQLKPESEHANALDTLAPEGSSDSGDEESDDDHDDDDDDDDDDGVKMEGVMPV